MLGERVQGGQPAWKTSICQDDLCGRKLNDGKENEFEVTE